MEENTYYINMMHSYYYETQLLFTSQNETSDGIKDKLYFRHFL